MKLNLDNFIHAFLFASAKHQYQKVKGSELPYMTHVTAVCFELLPLQNEPDIDADFLMTTAVLHDILEDTETSEEELSDLFGLKVMSAVKSLSKNYQLPKEDQIRDSIERILEQPKEVSLVKLADRITNLNPPPKTWDSKKINQYYNQSLLVYDKLSTANDYLANRFLKKIEKYRSYL